MALLPQPPDRVFVPGRTATWGRGSFFFHMHPLHRSLHLAGWFALALSASAATTTVNSIASLQAAINTATAGDTIIVQNGSYTTTSSISINRVGTAAAPIVIKAESIGGVTIAGSAGFKFSSPAAFVTLDGFYFRHAGSINIPSGTKFIRFTHNVVELTIPKGSDVSYLNIGGDDIEIGYNELRNKSTLGEMLDITGSGSQVARRLWVHHNYFHDFTSPGGNGAETIRWGLSGLSLSTGAGICEYNLFVRCTGENESISNKSSGNIYRYNTFIDSPGGQLSQRHGNFNLIYGNYFRNTDGIRIYGDNNQIFSNYLEGNTGGINIGNGDGEVETGADLTSHDKPDNTVVVFNTLINNNRQYYMTGRTGGLGAANTTFANNIIVGGGSAASISTTGPYTNPVWAGNFIWQTTPGNLPAGTYTSIDPQLIPDATGVFHIAATSPAINAAVGIYPAVEYDMDGQLRDSYYDVGADEFSTGQIMAKLLTTGDVGPGVVVPPPPVPDRDDTIWLESEYLAYAGTGASTSIATETTASSGTYASNFEYVSLAADANPPPPNGEYIQFTLPNIPAGTYDLSMRYKAQSNRGQFQMYVDGAPVGPVVDAYASSASFVELLFGTLRFSSPGNHVVRLAVTGKNAAATGYALSSDRFVLVPDTTPPEISPLPDLTVEATGPDGAVATYTGTAVDNRDGPVPVSFTPPSGSVFPLGTTLVVATAQDFAGNIATASFNVTVVDTTPPTISALTASPDRLGPPNHKLIPVTIAATVHDLVDSNPHTRIIGVTSNEPINGPGDGNTAPDYEITGDLTLTLRAERSGSGNGRIYTITVESRDASGNASTATVDVTVPHDSGS
jgi:hypothetical protein